MATIDLTAATLRALGEGVARLNDGDLDDCAKADDVVATLKAAGYVLSGYDFIPKPPRFVLSMDGQDYGSRETEQELPDLIRNAWMSPARRDDGSSTFELWDHEESRWRFDLAEAVLRHYR